MRLISWTWSGPAHRAVRGARVERPGLPDLQHADPDLQRAAAEAVQAGIESVDEQVEKLRTRRHKLGKGKDAVVQTSVLPGPMPRSRWW